jgi:hypothetical protein
VSLGLHEDRRGFLCLSPVPEGQALIMAGRVEVSESKVDSQAVKTTAPTRASGIGPQPRHSTGASGKKRSIEDSSSGGETAGNMKFHKADLQLLARQAATGPGKKGW